MKNFFTLITATAIAALSLISTQSHGSHAVAADITYVYVGPNQFLLTMRYYNDCAGIAAPTSVSIQYTSSCFANGSITLQPLPGTGQEIPPSPCLPSVISSCNGGTGYGIREYIYQGLVTLAGPCVDWRFSYSLCCRNDQINTIINPGAYNLFVSTTLDNFNFPTNSSPTFANIPVTQFCIGNLFYYSQLANDIDGDSLVFSLAISESALNTSVPYAPGYTFNSPMATSTPFTIDSQTGTISFTPSLQQVGVMAVVVSEYRNGVLVGTIKRDMQMKIVANCIGTVPTFAPPVDPVGNPAPYYTLNCGATSFYVILDQPVQCGSIVPTDIRVFTPQGTPNPVLSAIPVNCVNGQTDSILVTVFYPLELGITWAVIKEGFDNNTFLSECGVEMNEFDSIPYNVIDPGVFDTELLNTGCSFDQISVTFNYEVDCSTVTASGSEFYLIDANNIIYPVTSVNCSGPSGFAYTLTFDFGQFISPASPVYLIVQNGSDQNTFSNRCTTFIDDGDTLAILNVLSNLIVDLGNDQTLCDNDPLPVLDAGIANATYTWFLNGVQLPDQTQTIIASQSGTYSVTVSTTASCDGNDAVVITINPTPQVNLGNDISLCGTDPIPVLDAGNPGAAFQWYNNGVLIPGETNQTYQPVAAGIYSVIVNIGGICTGNDEIQIIIEPNLVVSLGPDQTVCSNDPLPVLDAGIPNGTYQWLLDGTPLGVNTQTIQTSAPGVYTVQVTSVSGCTGSDDFTLAIVQSPSVTLSDASVCPGNNFATLDAGNPGSQYLWSNGATTQTINPTAPGVYTVTVTNSGGGLTCSATASATLTEFNPVVVNLGNDLTACEGSSSIPIDAGNPGSTYVWSLDGNPLSGQTTQTINIIAAGTYSVVVTDANGCTGEDNVTLSVNLIPNINLGDDIAFCQNEQLPVLDATNPDVVSYTWTFNGTEVGTDATLQVTGFGTYVVTFIDYNGCENSEEVVVNEKPCDIDIPNVITPGNGDGKNDVFFIKNLDSNPNSKVSILNRWGREVYSSNDYQNNWNGGDLPDGTYFYIVLLQNGKDYKGTLKIIREK